MKRLLAFGSILLLIAVNGCGDSPTEPGDPQETGINITRFEPRSPATLKYYQTDANDRVRITYNYTVVEPGGARIWIDVFTSSAAGTAHFSPSPVLTGSGSRTVIVAISSNEDVVQISQLRVVMKSADQTSTYVEYLVDVDYTFTK